jgi:hypothetical protein
MEQMRKATLIGAVVAALITVGAAAALAAQSSPGTNEPDRRLGSHQEVHGWMTGDLDEMPMHDDSGLSGGHGMSGLHDEMHGWMTDNVDEMPMHDDSDGHCLAPANPGPFDPGGDRTST